MNIVYDDKLIANVSSTKFLGMVINNSLSWKGHIEQIIPKLSAACYAMTCFKPYVSQEALKVLLFLFSFHYVVHVNILWELFV